jgi:HemY protein
MMRFVFTLVCVLALTSLVAVIANLPGNVSIAVPGHIIDMPLTVLLGTGLTLLLGLLALAALGQWLWHLPQQIRAAQRARNQKDGEAALAGGLMALARGDAGAADEATRLARKKMPHQTLPLLMAAQAALLDGRRDDAAANYHAMLTDERRAHNPQHISLGLEGLYYLARAENDGEAAGTYALQALEVDGKALWALDGLMTLAVQIGDWPAAEKWLRRWGRAGRSRAQIKQRRAILALAEAQSLLAEDDPAAQLGAVKKAEMAATLDPKLLPATALAARLLARGGHMRQARKILKQAWQKTPHAVLAEAWLECHSDQPAAGRMRAVGRFIGKHGSHEEAAILRARIALAARRFRQAANLLAPWLDSDTPSRRICLLMADIEDGLERDIEAHGWRDKARRAPRDAGWTGGGMRLDEWQAICPVTGRLGGVAWQVPRAALTSTPLLTA